MKMKRLSMIMIVLLAMVIAGCGGKGSEKDNSLAKVKEQGFFILGLDDEFPPMGFRGEENNEITGFDIDLAKEVAKRIGVEVQLKPVAWDGIIFSLNKGDIDVIWNGLTITDERKAKIGFSKAYLNNRQIIMVQKGSSVQSMADLKGKIIGLQMGSSSENALNGAEKFASTLKDVKKYENNALALLDLESGRIDGVVIDEIVGRYSSSKKPGVYRVLKDALGNEEYGIGFRKGDVSFKNEVDRVLDEMKKDGSAAEISKKWFGEDILLKSAQE
jgi:polar amino acid transport system substrate-binding protein